MNKQTEADLLGLIDYLKETPEYNTPTDNGRWLDRIITGLTKITHTDTDYLQTDYYRLPTTKKLSAEQITELEHQLTKQTETDNNQ